MASMIRSLLLVALALSAASASATEAKTGHAHGHGHGHAHDDDDAEAGHLAEGAGLRALHPWTNATRADAALVFVEIANRGAAPVTITGAASRVAASATLVGFRLVEGATIYDPVGALALDPGEEIDLEPRGLAIRLEGLTAALAEGGTVAVTLETDRGPLALAVAVESADAEAHSHAGHVH